MFVLLVCIGITSPVKAAGWKYIAKSNHDSAITYIDTLSAKHFTKGESDMVKFWIKKDFKSAQHSEVLGDLDEVITEFKINCTEKSIATIAANCTLKGKKVYGYQNPANVEDSMADIIPDSIGDIYYNLVCDH
jgi:hypothetical protein